MGLLLWVTGAFGAALAHAEAPLLNQVHTIAAPTTGVPVEETFTIPTAGTYHVTLTDLGAALTPSAPLASLGMAVTSSSDAIVGTPLTAAGTLTLTSIPAGNYQLHVVGTPGNGLGSGPIGIVVSASNMTQVAAFQAIIALPDQALPNGEAVLDDSFTVPNAGSYTVSLNDLQLPQSLTALTLLVIAQGGTVPVVTLPTAGAYQATVSLSANVTYDIFAVGQANGSVNAGLYSAVVTAGGAGGTVIFGRAVPVGGTVHLGSPGLAAGNDTLSVADLAYPASLAQLGAALLLNGQPIAQLSGAGSQTFTASSATYEAYAVGTAAASGAGSYALQVGPAGGTPAFNAARGVTTAGSGLNAYGFDTSLAASGSATVTLADFRFPAALTSVSLAAEQGGALLGSPLQAPGSLDVGVARGPLSLVVFAQAGAAGGLFGIEVAPGADATAVYETTQSVGALFSTAQVPIPNAGSYSVTATDLGFPANFANYDTIVTQGTQQVGSIYGGGTFNFKASPGIYFVNFIAQTAGPAQAGTYALTVASAPPVPTVSLSVDHPQVSSGSSVDLVWSSQNATSCTASGGWSGGKALNGTATSAALTGDTTFTLTCSGAGGTTSKSVSVTVTAGGGGGGGSLDVTLLGVLTALLIAEARRRRSPRIA